MGMIASGKGLLRYSNSHASSQAAPLTMETTLKTVLALAGMPKIFRALSIPITAAAMRNEENEGEKHAA